MGKEWKFAQLGGSRRVMTLANASGPHGRPRKGAVVSDGVKLRKSRVYYPDAADLPPTTHVFGVEYTDWELKGRFSDVWLGPGGTKETIRLWKAFIKDALPVQITWGDILSANGIVDSITPERESEFECAYTIVVLIDSQDTDGTRSQIRALASPKGLCQRLQAQADDNLNIPKQPTAGDLKPDFLDSLEAAVSSINGFSASLARIAGEIDAFTEATFDQLERLRAGVAQMRTAVHVLQGAVETTENDAVLLARAADSDVQWFAARARMDTSMLTMLAILEELDREAEIARRSRIMALHTVQLGDTWESLSVRYFGSPGDSGTIRDANGVRYGELPIPGRQVQIPVV